jgi:hypothetical protein
VHRACPDVVAACVSANLIPAVCIVVMSYLDCTQVPAVMTLLTTSVGLTGFAFSSFLVNPFDIAPRYAIAIMSVSNTFACIPGIITPYVVAHVTKDVSDSFRIWGLLFV